MGLPKELWLFSSQAQDAMKDLSLNGINTEKGRRAGKFLQASIQAFFDAPKMYKPGNKEASIQAFTTTKDIPDPQFAFDTFQKISNWDNRYENAFKVRTFDANKGTFSIVDISNAFTFDKLPEGGSATIKKIKGESIDVKAVTYADAVGWTWEMLEDRMFSEMADMLQMMTQEFYASKSRNYYRLLSDAAYDTVNGNASVSWQGVSTDTVLTRDRLTLMKAVNDIAKACKDLGLVSDVASARYDVYAEPTNALRLSNAMNGALGVANGIGGVPPYNIVVNPTFNLRRTSGSVGATDFIVVMSGGKVQRGDKLPPQTKQSEDALAFASVLTVRARYAGVVAQAKQTIKGQLS
ncbi:hypothetical protein [Leptospira levettii]|uniref:phage major capsid protein n=1 Tax=Leptospira levettii TaxID=2023178 RepID=UPI000C29B08A|nr:hypothetical protein [Leptospira levettii]PJZ87927.1 hypothetical protein CH368_14290 [Leptospira levettii]